jgi:hypothetical protein
MMKEKKIVKHVPFEDRTVELVIEEELPNGKTKKYPWKTNRITADFVKNRYVVLRNFVPKDIINFTMDCWKATEHKREVHNAIFKREERDITFNSPKNSIGKSDGAYSSPWGIALNRYLCDKLRGVLDIDIRETYSYTRKYDRGAYLSSHRDRPACEISTTVCLDYKTDDGKPWVIWVDNSKNWVDFEDTPTMQQETQGIPNRKRESVALSLEVGDVLLYQGPNVAHWRDYLVGDYSYHIFSHFFNAEGMFSRHPKNRWTGEDTNLQSQITKYPMPLEYDGRLSRYHTQDDAPDELKIAYKDFIDSYEAKEYGLRSEFSNNYGNFKETKE